MKMPQQHTLKCLDCLSDIRFEIKAAIQYVICKKCGGEFVFDAFSGDLRYPSGFDRHLIDSLPKSKEPLNIEHDRFFEERKQNKQA